MVCGLRFSEKDRRERRGVSNREGGECSFGVGVLMGWRGKNGIEY